MKTVLGRQDGTVSRTKTLNMVGLALALAGAVLPAFQVYVPEAVYSALLACGVILNQHFRNTQSTL